MRLAPLVLLIALCWLSGCKTTPLPETVRYQPVAWSAVEGWQADVLDQAWSAFLQSCAAIGSRPEWRDTCDDARAMPTVTAHDARRFFENRFIPYRIEIARGLRQTNDTGLITGYYEPLLYGSRTPSAQYHVPLYAPPDDLLTIELGDLYPELKGKRVRGRLQGRKVIPYPSRAELRGHAALQGKELVWVDDPIDAFFLEIQGSGRVQLNDGETIRLAYGDQNGHAYRAIGRYLVERGEMTLEEVTAPAIRAWLRAHPEHLQEVLDSNPSAVFFRAEPIADPSQGPKGALAVPLTAGRSVAIDPKFIPLGAPVFMSTTQPAAQIPPSTSSARALQRLVMAQDAGGAIRGAIRADLFWGFGDDAGEQAGRMRQEGKLWLLLPKGVPPPQPHQLSAR